MANSYSVEAVMKASGAEQFINAFRDSAKAVEGLEKANKKIGDIGSNMSKNVTAPIVAGLGASIKASIDFETAMTGVAKTTDLSEENLAKMNKEIRQMSKEIPVSANEIANIVETAGQLGIAEENLLSFSRTMADLGVATDMTSDEAATAFARFANVTGMPQDNMDRLGATVVELGNNLAATESEIVQMASRLASTGSQVGLTEAEIMGLAGAMTSVGISAERGGTNMSKTMQQINTAVLSGSEDLDKFAKVAGLSSKEFAQVWKKDPVKAIDLFTAGLGDINSSGGDVTTTLKDLGISGSEQINVLNSMAGAEGLLTDATEMANSAWEENTALINEANTAYETTENSLIIMWNTIVDLAKSIGDILLPAFQNMVDKITSVIDWLNSFDEGTKETIIKLAMFVASIGPVLVMFSKFVEAGLIVAKAVMFVMGIITKLGGVMAILTNPITIVIGVIMALVGVFILLYQNADLIREKLGAVWESIKEGFSGLSEFAGEIWGAMWEVILGQLEHFKGIWTDFWNTIKQPFIDAWNEFKTELSEIFSEFISEITALGENVKKIFTDMWDILVDYMAPRIEHMKEIIRNFVDSVRDWFVNLGEKIVDVFKSLWARVIDHLQTQLKSFTDIMEFGFAAIADIVEYIFDTILMVIKTTTTAITSVMKGFFQILTGQWSEGFNTLMEGFVSIWSDILHWIVGFAETFEDVGANIINMLLQGIKGGAKNLTNGVKNVLGGIRDLLPFSPPKDKSSPLMGIEKNGIGTQIAAGIMRGQQEVDAAMKSILDVPNIDLNADIGTTSEAINGKVQHEIKNNGKVQPAYISLNIGGQVFRAFVSNISNEQDAQEDLEMAY